MAKRFTKRQETFICENCGTKTVGTGYTNHCPRCLWSKHVDIHPGDRLEECGGMMKPVSVEFKSGDHRIIHRCLGCGKEKKNKVAPNDSMETLITIARKATET